MNMNEYEWLIFMLLEDFRERVITLFSNRYMLWMFCYRIEATWSFRYEILGPVGLLKEKPLFFVTLGIAEIQKNFKLYI